jgi:DNA-directed RNA polymerase specialized sigma subunit
MAPIPDEEPGQKGFRAEDMEPEDSQERSEAQRVQDLAEAARRDHLGPAGLRGLDAAEHRRLLDAAGRGDRRALESLTAAHLDWVLGAAQERANRGLSEEDLFQEGTIGLIEAIQGFAASGRHDFEVFAREHVASHMDRALGLEEKAVQDSRLLLQAAHDYVEAEFNVRRDLGRSATSAEIAAKLEWSVQRTEEIGRIVTEAQRRYDEEIVQYLEPGDIDLDVLFDERHRSDAN